MKGIRFKKSLIIALAVYAVLLIASAVLFFTNTSLVGYTGIFLATVQPFGWFFEGCVVSGVFAAIMILTIVLVLLGMIIEKLKKAIPFALFVLSLLALVNAVEHLTHNLTAEALCSFFVALIYAFIGLQVLCLFTDKANNLKERLNKLWFCPIALAAVTLALNTFSLCIIPWAKSGVDVVIYLTAVVNVLIIVFFEICCGFGFFGGADEQID